MIAPKAEEHPFDPERDRAARHWPCGYFRISVLPAFLQRCSGLAPYRPSRFSAFFLN